MGASSRGNGRIFRGKGCLGRGWFVAKPGARDCSKVLLTLTFKRPANANQVMFSRVVVPVRAAARAMSNGSRAIARNKSNQELSTFKRDLDSLLDGFFGTASSFMPRFDTDALSQWQPLSSSSMKCDLVEVCYPSDR